MISTIKAVCGWGLLAEEVVLSVFDPCNQRVSSYLTLMAQNSASLRHQLLGRKGKASWNAMGLHPISITFLGISVL